MITNRKILHITYNIVAFIIGIGILSGPALAVPITYDITYDPSSGIATLFNPSSNSADLEFWTLIGSLEKTPLFLAPGDTVTIDATGSITGHWHHEEEGFVYDNKTAIKLGSITFNQDFRGIIVIKEKDKPEKEYKIDENYVKNNEESCQLQADKKTIKCIIQIPKDTHVSMHDVTNLGDIRVNIDAEVSPMTSYTDVYFEGPDWPGTPNQANIELLSGSLRSVDDTSTFTSLFIKDVVGAGCPPIPEPPTLPLVALGLAGLWMGKRNLSTSSQST